MLDRVSGPAAYIPQIIALTLPAKRQLNNGNKVFLFNAGEQKVCKIELVFQGGKTSEKHRGAALITSKLLTEGTKKKTATEFSEFLDYYGAFLDSSSTLDDNQITLYCQSEHLSNLIPVLAEMLYTPVFGEDEFNKIIKKQKQQLSINEQKTQYWATKLFREGLYGYANPYGILNTIEDFNTLTLEDVKAYHAETYLNASFDVFISGQFDEQVVISLLDTYLSASNSAYKTSAPLNFGVSSKHLVEYALEDSNQSSIKMGQRVIGRSHNEYPALALTNKLFGGYFGSRLMKEIREEKGLTYGIHSAVMHLKQDSFLQISADVKMDSWGLVLELIQNEMETLKQQTVTEEELQLVKNFMIGEFQSEINTTFDLASKYKMLYYNDLPDQWYGEFLLEIQQCSAEQIQATAGTFLVPDQMLKVAVQ
jgi:zinc protease